MTAAQVGRFTMRDLNPWEGPQLFVMTGNPDVTRYMGFRTHSRWTKNPAHRAVPQQRSEVARCLFQ